MGDDYRIPSKEDLYATVDERFREANPDAPAKLDADGEEHADYRAAWSSIFKDVLDELANRIYWDAFPQAPVVIDPHNPSHRRYAEAWNDIYARVRANEPVPPMAAGTPTAAVDAGLSEVRAGMYEQLADMFRRTPEGMHHQLQAAIDWHIAEALKLPRNDEGRYPGYVSDTQVFEFTEPGGPDAWKVTVQVGVSGTENYGVSSWVDFSIDDPNIEMLDADGYPALEPDPDDP